jgi:putative PIN family toxin of toxin-antitoxin system
MKVVLDSNVIVAAFAARGICCALFEYCVENHEVVFCAEILQEVERALVRKVGLPKAVARDVLQYLRGEAELVHPIEIDPLVCRDKDDAPILGAAAAAGCSYLITGDEDLLSIGRHEGVRIVSPRTFWETMKRGKGHK